MGLTLGMAGNNSAAVRGNTDQPLAQIRCGILTNPPDGRNSHTYNAGVMRAAWKGNTDEPYTEYICEILKSV